MKMMALRNGFVDDRPILDFVTLENNDLIKMLRERARCQ
jgi:hypothetical protein